MKQLVIILALGIFVYACSSGSKQDSESDSANNETQQPSDYDPNRGLGKFELTADYRLPANACNSYTYLYEKIKAFENDLFQHIHLENNILFPKVIKIENERLAHR